MMDKVVKFTGLTTLGIPADQVLEGAIGKLDSVIILGYDKEDQSYFAATTSHLGEILLIMERFKQSILEGE